jgi:hypothetical protein
MPFGRLERDDFRLTRRVGLASSAECLAARDRELDWGILIEFLWGLVVSLTGWSFQRLPIRGNREKIGMRGY